MNVDEQLALASALSEGLGGKALALVKDSKIVLDSISGQALVDDIESLARGFISRRKDSLQCSVESKGDILTVHTSDPLARSRGRKHPGLPDNLLKCPSCPFVTPYQEMYNVHVRSHGFVA